MEPTRRRGAALEADLLDAAWDELRSVGYTHLTMEGVALRARTGKQVLYRRWSNRAELIVAALRHRRGSLLDQVPDTGTLRGDVLALMRFTLERQREIGQDVFRGLLAEVADMDPHFSEAMRTVLATLLARAADRGEIPTADLPRRVVSLPVDLLRYDMLVRLEGVSEGDLVAIVDDVFLPLVLKG